MLLNLFILTVAYAGESKPLPIANISTSTTSSINPSTGLMQILFGLIAVLSIMLIAAWLFKKIGPISSRQKLPIKVIGGINVGNRERIMVLEVADQWLIVGVTAHQINTLSTLPKQEVSENEVQALSPENQFSSWLKKTIEKRNAV